MLIDVRENVEQFLSIVLASKKQLCLKDEISRIHASLEFYDLDLCIPELKKNSLYKTIAEDLIKLIEFYYENIEENINHFSDKKARAFLSHLRNSAKIIKNRLNV